MRDVSSRVFLFLVVLSFVVGHVLSVRSVWSQGSPAALSDDFNDNSLDTTKWNANSLFSGYIDLNIPTSETGQRLEIGPLLTNVPDSHYRGIRSVNTYNFSGAYCYVELVQPASSTTKADAMFTVGNDVNNYYRLYVSEGILYGLRKIGGSKTTLFSLPYDPVNHRFLRIRHEATGSVSLDTAPGSGEIPGTWVQRYSEIWGSSISLTATIFELKGGTWQPESNAPGKVIFDNFRFGSNSGSPPTVNAVSPNSGTINGGTVVNITGSRFTSGATVSLGGSLATNITVLSSSSIIATTPAHSAGTVNVVVTNPDGQSGTFANAYTYSSAPPPQTGLLTDDFNDNLLDTAKWNPNSLFSGYIDLNIPISETGQRLEIGPLLSNVPDSHYRGIRSVNTYNFSGAYCYVELVQPPSSTTKADAMFTVGNDVNNYYRLYVSEGILYGLRKAGGVKTTLFSISYDPVNHRFLRIRHDTMTGNVTLDTAAGSGAAPGSWVQRYSEAWNSSISLNATIFELKGGTWQPEANAGGKVIFDNFRAAVPGSGGGGLAGPILDALLDPLNRTGGAGENPLSRNFNFSVPLLGLPGRAGLDLNLSLAYNSLVWLNTGTAMSFNEDAGFPSPGFRLGFPVLQVRANPNPENGGKNSYLLLSSDGSHTQFRQVGTSSLYESTDSTYALLDTTTMILRTADGRQLSFAGGKCTQIKDRNGNYIAINYDGFGRIDTVVDTLSRTIKFNYDTSQTLASITQNWTINGQSQEHIWASFTYANIPIQTNFPDLFVTGPQNGSTIRALTQVTVNDGSRFNFEYTSWGQVWKIRNYAADGHLLNYRSYDLPQTNTVPLQDCPRFTERRGWAENWNRSGAPGPAGLPAGPEQEVITRYDVPVGVSWTPPNGSFETGTLARVTAPDGTYNKIYFAGTGEQPTQVWRRGLPAYVETYNATHDLQRQVVTTWTQDTAISTTYEVNPRVTETNTYDPSGNRVRVVIDYESVNIGDGTTCKLPQDVSEYQANASTVLRRTHTKYNLTAPYTSRRIIGLPREQSLYEVDPNTLTETPMSKLEFYYDESPIEGTADPVAIQHDNTNFGLNFLVGRANLTSVRRYDVENETQFTTTTNKYNRTGSLVSAKDAVGHEVTLSYTDAFASNADPPDTERPFKTLAYPTKVDDADGYSTKFRYNYDFGARTWQQTPLPNVTDHTPGPVQTFSYDVNGRLIRTTSVANNAFTRYNYGPNYVETFSSVNSIVETANEGHKLIVFDGLGRTIANASDHPNSTGGFSAQLILYDRMGRVQKQSNPTETNISITGNPINPTQFAALGDDAPANGGFGWKYTEQTYDWKGRPLVTTNQDGTTKEASYEGCGCAGGEVVTLTDEGTTADVDPGPAVSNVTKKRQRKFYRDVLRRTIKTEILNWQSGSEYSTTVVAYNARDQVTGVKQYQGSEGSAVFQETSMIYDGFGRLKTRKVPEQKSDVNISGSTDHTTWEYNADDTVQSITDARGITTTFGYNARHLLTSISYPPAQNGIPATSNVTYNYDAAGNRTSMSDPSGNNVAYNYDSLSRVLSEGRQFAGLSGTYTLTYDYNFADQVKTVNDQSAGTSFSYVTDKAGRLSTVTSTGLGASAPLASNARYRASGALRQWQYGNATQMNLAYNTRGLIAQYSLTGVKELNGAPRAEGSDFQYHADGQVKFASDSYGRSVGPTSFHDKSYQHDQAGRVQVALSGIEANDFVNNTYSGSLHDAPPYLQSYTHDVWNNQLDRTGTYWSETNDLGQTQTYDAHNRNLAWSYDPDGRLLSMNEPAPSELPFVAAQHTYDAAGRHVKQTQTTSRVQPLPGNPVWTTVTTVDATYDGDGQQCKRVETKQINGQQPTSATRLFVRSTVLGGQVITEYDGLGGRQKSYVYGGGALITWTPNAGLIWRFNNPVTGDGRETDGLGRMVTASYLDPEGVDVRAIDPANTQGEPTPPDPLPRAGAYAAYLPHSLGGSGRCSVDGFEVGCALVSSLQAGESDEQCPNNECTRYNPNLRGGLGGHEDFHSYADEHSFYLPAGVSWTGSNLVFPGGLSFGFIDGIPKNVVPPNSSGEQLSSCLRDALRKYFPEQVAQGKSYSPIDDSRFKNWIPTWVTAAAAITPGVVTPQAITLGLFDIHYDPKAISVTGGNVNSLQTVIEEVLHTVQFLQVWAGLKPNPWAAAKIGNDFTDYYAAQNAWQSHYSYYAIKGLGYDNDVERWAKANVQRIMSDLRLHDEANQGQLCGFDLYPRTK